MTETVSVSSSVRRRIEEAVHGAASFLSLQLQNGRCNLACAASDGSDCPIDGRGQICAGFFVAEALLDIASDVDRRYLLAPIRAEDQGNVWGYCAGAPPDSDDTAFALRTLQMLGMNPAESGLVSFFSRQTRLFPTFKSPVHPTLVFDLTPENNAHAHPEVAANIYLFLASRNSRSYWNDDLIEAAQTDQGWWRSFYYPGKYYATRLFLSLLARTRRLAQNRARGIAFIRAAQQDDGGWGEPSNAYETALALQGLLSGGGLDPAADPASHFLLRNQQSNGSWSYDGVIWQSPRRGPWQFGKPIDGAWPEDTVDLSVFWRAFDSNRVVVTSLCLRALRDLLELSNRRG